MFVSDSRLLVIRDERTLSIALSLRTVLVANHHYDSRMHTQAGRQTGRQHAAAIRFARSIVLSFVSLALVAHARAVDSFLLILSHWRPERASMQQHTSRRPLIDLPSISNRDRRTGALLLRTSLHLHLARFVCSTIWKEQIASER